MNWDFVEFLKMILLKLSITHKFRRTSLEVWLSKHAGGRSYCLPKWAANTLNENIHTLPMYPQTFNLWFLSFKIQSDPNNFFFIFPFSKFLLLLYFSISSYSLLLNFCYCYCLNRKLINVPLLQLLYFFFNLYLLLHNTIFCPNKN